MDEVRRAQWIEQRAAGMIDAAAGMKGTRWALLKRPLVEARASLDQWPLWASRSRLQPIRVAHSIRRVPAFIDATLQHSLSNGRVESIDAKIRLIQHRACGYHHPSPLIALAKLTLSGFRPALPRRA